MNDKSFKELTFNDDSGIGILVDLMNVFFCRGFSREENSMVILMCNINLVSYYFSKGFLVLEYWSDALNNLRDKIKQQIHTIHKYSSDCSMMYKRYILYIVKHLRNIQDNYGLFHDFSATLYNDKNTPFHNISRNLKIYVSIDPSIIQGYYQ